MNSGAKVLTYVRGKIIFIYNKKKIFEFGTIALIDFSLQSTPKKLEKLLFGYSFELLVALWFQLCGT